MSLMNGWSQIEKRQGLKIDYQTADGVYPLNLARIGRSKGLIKVSTGKMKKSDGTQTLQSLFSPFKYKTDKKPLITKYHVWQKSRPRDGLFANREDFFKIDRSEWCRPDGNLPPFEGAYSNDTYEKCWNRRSWFLNLWLYSRRILPKQDQCLSKYCKWGDWLTFWVEALKQVGSIKKKSPRSEKAIMKFISQGKMRLRSVSRSKPCTDPAGVTGPDGRSLKNGFSFGDVGLSQITI